MIPFGRILPRPSHNMEAGGRLNWRMVAIVCVFSMLCGVAWQQEVNLPSFSTTPPQLVEFSNMTGTRVPCSPIAINSPTQISWLSADGFPLKPIRGLREVLSDGTLVLNPFRAEKFRQDVHSTSYKCALTNSLGTIVSNDVTVKAVVLQPYDVYVYDVFTMIGSTAVMKCHVPKVISTHVTVTSWIKDSRETITASALEQDSRFFIIPSGELFIKEVTKDDGKSTFDCVITNKLTAESKNSVISGKLFVTDPQGNVPPKITFSKTTIQLPEGEAALLPCEAQGYPLPNIRWSRISDAGENERVFIKNRYSLISGSLLIKNAHNTDSGTYTCTASNVAGSEKAESQLIVSEPLLVTIEPSNLVVDNGKSATLTCKTNANPMATISWLKDGQALTSLPAIEMLNNQSFRINSFSSEHKGIYQCLVKGSSEEAFAVSVLTLGDSPPLLVSGFEERTLQPGVSLNVQCTFSGSPAPEVSWFVDDQAVSITAVQTQSINSDENITSVLNMERIRTEEGGMYSCLAVNKAGKVGHSARINVYGSLGSRQRTKLTAVSGQTVLLNCPFYGYPFGTIAWEKGGETLPNNVRQRHTQYYSLKIQEVRRNSDSGIYTCSVKEGSRTVRSEVQLIVMVPPQILPFTFQDDQFFKGMRAHIICAVSQGDLPLQFQWLKDGQPIQPSLGVITRNYDGHANSLSIESVLSGHTGNYTCVVTNNASKVTHTAQLLVHVPPKIVPFFFQDDQLVEGMPLRVSCVISRGDLPLNITWLKDGVPIYPEHTMSIRMFDEYSSILSIEPVSIKHNGNYSCIARNHAASASHTAELKIQVPPKWLNPPVDVTTKSGETVHLHCKASGLPEPTISWTWAKDTQSQISSLTPSTDTVIMRNGSVILKTITKEQEGFYFCTASNGVGDSLSKSVNVRILAPPVFQEKEKATTGIKGENLTLVCSAFGDQPISFIWNKANNAIINPLKEPRYVIKNGKDEKEETEKSELTITWLDRKDSILYTCNAENEYGNDKKIFSVTVQEFPDAPVIDSVKEGNHSVSLSWQLGYDGNSPVTKLMVQYKKKIDNWQTSTMNVTVPGDATSVFVSGLQPATTYNFRVAAENAIGLSAFSKIATGASQEDVPSGSPLNVEVESTDQHTLRVTWKPPRKNHWNGAIRGYNIGYKIEGSSESFIFQNLEVPEDYVEDLIYQLSELQMFTQYSVIVQAYNSKGRGPSSEPVIAMTSEDVPSSPPQGVRCSALSSKSVYVLWDPPSSESTNGIIRGFKVLYKPVSEWYDSAVRMKTSHSTKLPLQELEVNTNYTIQVLAFTKVGDGIKSSPVYCKTHEDVPESPQEIKVLPSSADSVVVAWKSPKNSNGGITKYNVYYKPLEQGQQINPASDGSDGVVLMTEQVTQDPDSHTSRPDNQFLEVKGLKKNKKYAFWVTASSVIGEGPSSKIMAQTVADSSVPAKSASFDGTIKTPWKRDVVLPCKAVGVPPPKRKWMVGAKPLEVVGRNILLSDGTLLINKVSSEDSGNYTCAIYNELGKDNVKYALVVQVPPAAPLLDVVSKRRSAVQLQWKSGPDGGDKVKGYILHFRQESGAWETKELSPDNHVYTLNGLSCGTSYQMYLEAFNSIGTGPPCDVITVATEGSELLNPSKESVIREGSTYATIHLEAWPSTGCPIEKFHVEYKLLHSHEWTLVSDSIRPSQKKLVLPGLNPATWFVLRLTAETSGRNNVAEYRFATLTSAGGTIPPPEIMIEHKPEPVYLFYLDPYIFIPSVALLVVVIIASVVMCVCMKRKNGSIGSPSDSDSTINTWSRGMHPGSYDTSQYPTLHHQGSKDPNPYATAQLPDFILQHPCSDMFLGHSGHPQAWSGTVSRRTMHPSQGFAGMPHGLQNEHMQQAYTDSDLLNTQETTFVFPTSTKAQFAPRKENPRPDQEYDRPPVGI